MSNIKTSSYKMPVEQILYWNLLRDMRADKVSVDSSTVTRAGRSKDPTGLARKQHVMGKDEARELRDAFQRAIARKRNTELRRMIPKAIRLRDVREAQRVRFESRVYNEATSDPMYSSFYAEDQGSIGTDTRHGQRNPCGAAANVAIAVVAGLIGRLAVSAGGRLNKVLRGSEEAVNGVNNIIKKISEELTRFKEMCVSWMGKLWVFPLAFIASWLLRRVGANPLVMAALATIFSSIFGNVLWAIIAPITQPVVEQSGMDDMADVVASLFAVSYMPKEMHKFVPELSRRMSNLPRASDGFKKFLSVGMNCVEVCLNFVLSRLGKEPIYFGDATEVAVKEWLHKAEVFESDLVKSEPNSDTISRILSHIQDGYVLRSTVNDEKYKALLVRCADRLETRMRNFAGSTTALKAFRAEPVMMVLVGASKQGKTTMLAKLATFILLMSGLANSSNVLSEIWQQGESKYYESYRGQAANVMDDCFQEKFKAGMENSEFMQIIRKVNNWSYPCNMASVDLKAKVFFQSKLIIGTTNVRSIHATNIKEVINCVDAVVRRIHFALHIEASEEFRILGDDGRYGLDYAKFTKAVEDGKKALQARISGGYKHSVRDVVAAYPWRAWDVHNVRFGSDGTLTTKVDMVDLVVQVAEEIMSRGRSHLHGIDSINDYNNLMESAFDFQQTENLASVDTVEEQGGWFRPKPAIESASNELKQFYNTARNSVRVIATSARNKLEQFSRVAKEVLKTMRQSPLFMGISIAVTGAAAAVLAKTFIKSIFEFICKGAGAIFQGLRGLVPGLSKDDSALKNADGTKVATSVVAQSNITEKPNPKRRGKPWASNVVEQSYDGSQSNQITDVIYGNSYKMVMARDGSAIGQFILVKDHIAMMPHHFVRGFSSNVAAGKLDNDDVIHLIKADQCESKRQITVGEFLNMRKCGCEDGDVTFVQFDHRTLPPGKDLTKHMFDSETLERAVRTHPGVRLDVCQIVKRDNGSVRTSRQTMYSNTCEHLSELVVASRVKRDVIMYQMPTEVGQCGAPLCVMEPRFFGGKSFVGFHVAGKQAMFTRYGYAAPVTTEMVGEAMKFFQPKIVDKSLEQVLNFDIVESTVETQSLLKEVGLLGGSFTLLGEVIQPIHTPPYTKLTPTPMREIGALGEFTHSPAHLKSVLIDGEMRHPMVEGLRNYQSPVYDEDVPYLSACVAIATQPFRAKTIHESRFIFDFSEAVKGVEGLKIKTINRKTSAGYPYVLGVTNGKKDFFGYGDEFDLTGPKALELERDVNNIIACAKRGERLLHVCTDFLKDELRPEQKVANCQTRVISGSPLDYVIAVRMYFGAFIAACFRHNIDTGLCPGINPYQEWWRLTQHLKSNCKTKVFDGDFKRFDASEQPNILWAILDFINDWYDDGEENKLIREVLWLDVVQSRHLTGFNGELKYIIQWSKSLPSGHPLTTIINSWYCLFALTIAYAYNVGNVTTMWEHISPASFGDDNIVGVSDTVCEVFNQVTVAEAMKEVLHLDYTSGSKDGFLTPYKTLEECTFLKRSFLPSDDGLMGGWTAPLAYESFLYTTYYNKGKTCDKDDLAAKLEASLGELSLHPAAVWDEYFPKFKVAFGYVDAVPMFNRRSDYRSLISTRDDFWF